MADSVGCPYAKGKTRDSVHLEARQDCLWLGLLPLCACGCLTFTQLGRCARVRLNIVFVVDKGVGLVASAGSFPMFMTIGAYWIKLEMTKWVWQNELRDYQPVNDTIGE